LYVKLNVLRLSFFKEIQSSVIIHSLHNFLAIASSST